MSREKLYSQYAKTIVVFLGCLSFIVSVRCLASEYESCTEKNSYLEAELANFKHINLAQCHSDATQIAPKVFLENFSPILFEKIPKVCIQRSMQLGPTDTRYYYKCNENQAKSFQRYMPKPCVSEKLVTLVHQAYLAAAKCTGADVQEGFALLNEESAFQVNIGVGGYGISQFNNSAAYSFNTNKVLDMILKENPERCRDLIPFLKKSDGTIVTKANPVNECEFMTLPFNPGLGLFYSTAYMAMQMAKVKNGFVKFELEKTTPFDSPEAKLLRRYVFRVCYAAPNECHQLIYKSVTYFKRRFQPSMSAQKIKGIVSAAVMDVGGGRSGPVLGGQTVEFIAKFNSKVDSKLRELDRFKDHEIEGQNFSDFCMRSIYEN